MRINTKKFFIFGIGLFLMATFAVKVEAATTSTPKKATVETRCFFQNELDSLEALNNNFDIDYTERVKTELDIRRSILKKIISCGIEDAESFKTELDKFQVDDRDLLNLQRRFSLELDQAINYYRISGATIDEMDITETKKLAFKLSDWRKNNFRYTTGGIINLITWVGNQGLFKATENRFDQISKTVVLSKTEDSVELNKFIKEAEINLKEALSTNQESKRIIQGFSPPNKTTLLIRSSLGSLSEVYKNFFEIDKIINNKKLPQ